MANVTVEIRKNTLVSVGIGIGEVDVDITSTDFTINNGAIPFFIYCITTAGDAKVDFWNGETGKTITLDSTYKEKPILVTKVYKTGTTAVGLKAIY